MPASPDTTSSRRAAAFASTEKKAPRPRRTTESRLAAQYQHVISVLETEEYLARKTHKLQSIFGQNGKKSRNARRAYQRAARTLSHHATNVVVPELHKYDNMCFGQLCSKMLDQLPRELRDIIYAYMLPPAEVIVNRRLLDQGILNDEVDKPDKYRIWRHDIVGKRIVLEVSEHWYHTRTFMLLLTETSMLHRFLESNRNQFGLTLKKTVSHVVLGSSYFETPRLSRNHRRKRILDNMEKLVVLKQGTKVDFHFSRAIIESVLNENEKREAKVRGFNIYDQAEFLLVAPLVMLREKGLRVRIFIDLLQLEEGSGEQNLLQQVQGPFTQTSLRALRRIFGI